MELSYRDKHYIRSALKMYIGHLSQYNKNEEDITEDVFSNIQDDIMLMNDLLYEVEQNIDQLKKNTAGGAKLYVLHRKSD